jgi:hypothetical protein
MGTVSNDAQSGLVALLLTVELATLLSRHVLGVEVGWTAGLVEKEKGVGEP